MESEQTCRLCTRDVSESAAAIHLYSPDSVERGVADRMADLLEVPLEKTDGLGSYICELCNARFKHLVRSLEVHRLNAKKNYEKQAKKAGIYVESKFPRLCRLSACKASERNRCRISICRIRTYLHRLTVDWHASASLF